MTSTSSAQTEGQSCGQTDGLRTISAGTFMRISRGRRAGVLSLVMGPQSVDAFERTFEAISARAQSIDALDTPEQGAPQ